MAHGMGFLQDMPLDRFCNFVWHMLSKDADKKELAKLRAQLWQPVKGETVTDPRSPWSAANEKAGLMAFKASLGG